MFWDSQYEQHNRVWGEEPSELASFAVNYLQRAQLYQGIINILDIGCGYGRDALYLSQCVKCRILGIDNSPKAIEFAEETRLRNPASDIRFQWCDFYQLTPDKYDVVFVSNLYQLLKPDQRTNLREIIKTTLQEDGLMFLSTLSVSDPEHYGRGTPVSGEVNSYMDEKYLHFCMREELERDFNFLLLQELFEHQYDEPHTGDETHHHVCWITVGQYSVVR